MVLKWHVWMRVQRVKSQDKNHLHARDANMSRLIHIMPMRAPLRRLTEEKIYLSFFFLLCKFTRGRAVGDGSRRTRPTWSTKKSKSYADKGKTDEEKISSRSACTLFTSCPFGNTFGFITRSPSEQITCYSIQPHISSIHVHVGVQVYRSIRRENCCLLSFLLYSFASFISGLSGLLTRPSLYFYFHIFYFLFFNNPHRHVELEWERRKKKKETRCLKK